MKVVDLSQPLGPQTQVHPAFFTPLILRHFTHQDPPPPSGVTSKTNVLIMSNHSGTHVDSLSHLSPSLDAPDIYDMPLDLFVGEAVCIDCRQFPSRHYITVEELQSCLRKQELGVQSGDIVLFCTDHYRRTAGTPAFLTDYSGISPELVHWMADRRVKIFGTETISPDVISVTDQYSAHRACGQRGLAHYENLNNLVQVMGRRFLFVGAPLPLTKCAGSPVRALAIFND